MEIFKTPFKTYPLQDTPQDTLRLSLTTYFVCSKTHFVCSTTHLGGCIENFSKCVVKVPKCVVKLRSVSWRCRLQNIVKGVLKYVLRNLSYVNKVSWWVSWKCVLTSRHPKSVLRPKCVVREMSQDTFHDTPPCRERCLDGKWIFRCRWVFVHDLKYICRNENNLNTE